MPLRDHFRDRSTWQPVHGGWPMVIVQHLARSLPPRYQALPKINLGPFFEIDIAAIDGTPQEPHAGRPQSAGGGTALLPAPTMTLDTVREDRAEYEVEIIDTLFGRVVAAIELVSPSNKDRPDTREDFVAKCAHLVRGEVCVSLVDLVTSRNFNLYAELLDELGHADPGLPPTRPAAYAATLRYRRLDQRRARFESWPHALRIGDPLPVLPIWLSEDEGVLLDLEATYEETCRTLRIA